MMRFVQLGLRRFLWGVAPLALGAANLSAQEAKPTEDLYKLDLEQLLKIEFKSAAGLTEVDYRRLPVAMTEIDARDLDRSGAVDLNQAFEMFVPNGQYIDHHHLQAHVGLRGIISDREDKYLFQVNDRTMNNRMAYGADNERGIPLLGDIKTVSVVRGPASTTHGAGALAGVFSLQTHTGLTFQGFDLKLREGVVNQFTAGEARYGKKLSDDSGVFLYYGIADVQGADNDAASYYIGRSYPASNGLPANVAGEPSSAPIANYWTSGFGSPYQKAHASFVKGPFEIWVRYVQDGHQDRPLREIYSSAKPASLSVDDWVRGRQFTNKQTTAVATFKKQISSEWRLNLMGSFDAWRLHDQRMGTQTTAPNPRNAGEDEAFGRAIATWAPSAKHSVAIGTEFSHESFNDPYFSDALDRAPVVTDRKWNTDTVSFLGEYQWKPSAEWTVFLGARTDKHTYSDWLFSPRGTIVFTPNDNDTFKAIVGQSIRRGGDEELWAEHVRKNTVPDPEKLLSYELAYERKLSDRFRVGANAFYENYDAIGWIPALYYSSSIGNYKTAGGELVLSYIGPRTRVTFSEGITKLVDASVPNLGPAGQAITAKPYGYGNDLAEWAPFITKLTVSRDLHAKWAVNGSLIYYSGFPGAQDYANYAATLSVPPSAVPLSDPGYSDPYGANLYVHLGLEYRPIEKLTLRVTGYNLAELFDEKLSKRNFYFRLSEFNVQPASLALSVRYRF
jgi:outer membrane receptor protein involved in Fe transport